MLSVEVVPLPVTDVDRALAFYTKQAGFTRWWRSPRFLGS